MICSPKYGINDLHGLKENKSRSTSNLRSRNDLYMRSRGYTREHEMTRRREYHPSTVAESDLDFFDFLSFFSFLTGFVKSSAVLCNDFFFTNASEEVSGSIE